MIISICMCTFNGELYLKEQLDSLVQQTVLPDEIVVYDDCSQDRTVDILLEYATKYSAINWCIYKNEHNVGWRVNFKKALESTSGDIIFFCDQDDIWMPDKIKRMRDVLLSNSQIDVLVADFMPFYSEGSAEKHIKIHSKNTGKVSIINPSEKLIYCQRPGCVFAFRSGIKKDFLLCWSQEFAHDGLMWRIACLRRKLYHIDYVAIKFRRHQNNASSNRYRLLSKERAVLEKKTNKQFLSCFRMIESSRIIEDEHQILRTIIKFLEMREKYYSSPSIRNFLKLGRFIKCYRKPSSIFKDLGILLHRA